MTDTAQRIYPRGSVWSEAGLTIQPANSFKLSNNYRNTRQIAALAASVSNGLTTDDDGNLPDPGRCVRDGPLPKLIKGSFNDQLAFAMERLGEIDLSEETVGFLHLKGGGWFDTLRAELEQNDIDYAELQGASEWPENTGNVGLCTFHSAKGLEFDHVFALGLSNQLASFGDEIDDDRLEAHRRLLAMGIGRARTTLTLGTKPSEALVTLEIIDPQCMEELIL